MQCFYKSTISELSLFILHIHLLSAEQKQKGVIRSERTASTEGSNAGAIHN